MERSTKRQIYMRASIVFVVISRQASILSRRHEDAAGLCRGGCHRPNLPGPTKAQDRIPGEEVYSKTKLTTSEEPNLEGVKEIM